MSAKKFKELAADELLKQEQGIRKEIMDFSFQKATGQLKNTALIAKKRKELAQLLTIKTQKASKDIDNGK